MDVRIQRHSQLVREVEESLKSYAEQLRMAGKDPRFAESLGLQRQNLLQSVRNLRSLESSFRGERILEDPAAREEIYKHLEKSLESGNHTKLRQLALSKTCGLKASSRPKRRRH
jgi:hypothetical protein